MRSVLARLDVRALNILISAAINAVLGLTCLLSDPLRFTAAAFSALRDDPGGLTSWSTALVVAALVIAGGLVLGPATTRVSLLLVAVVHVFLTVGFVEAYAADPAASPWGWVWFGAFALRLVAQAVSFPAPSSTSSSPAGPVR